MTAETRRATLGVIAVLFVLASPFAVIFLASNPGGTQETTLEAKVGQMAAAERLQAACRDVQALNIKMQGLQAGHHGVAQLRPELRNLSELTCGG